MNENCPYIVLGGARKYDDPLIVHGKLLPIGVRAQISRGGGETFAQLKRKLPDF